MRKNVSALTYVYLTLCFAHLVILPNQIFADDLVKATPAERYPAIAKVIEDLIKKAGEARISSCE